MADNDDTTEGDDFSTSTEGGTGTRGTFWDMTKSAITNLLSNLLDFLLWIFWGEASVLQTGQSNENPLEIQAVPGLTALLDISLFRAVEAELTGTIHTSHALLQVWLDIQVQSRRVLQFLKRHHHPAASAQSNSNNNNYNSDANAFRTQLEHFARSCYNGSCDAIERMSTDRFAESANLSDPFDNNGNMAAMHNFSSTTAGGSSHYHTNSGSASPAAASQHDFLLSALQESSWDTGRRRLPIQQRPRDCWESPRLYCPDYVWGDEVVGLSQKIIRYLAKHPFCALAFSNTDRQSSILLDGGGVVGIAGAGVDNLPPNSNVGGRRMTSLVYLTNTLEREEATLLLQLALVDASCRLTQFKAALDAESVVSKRLYLVKSEYRAPLRAFWEAHSSVQRAPSIELVQESLQRISSSSSSGGGVGERAKDRRNKGGGNSNKDNTQDNTTGGSGGNSATANKAKLQKLLEQPELVELVALERQIEQYEVDMALSLFPFCELARYLDQKKAIPRNASNQVLETLARLKNILVVSGGNGGSSIRQFRNTIDHPSSAGIRPLLLDFQGIPRDDEDEDLDVSNNILNFSEMYYNSEGSSSDDVNYLKSSEVLARIDARVDDFVDQLKFLIKQCCSTDKKKNAFFSEKKTDIDPPSASYCRKFDGELFKCLFRDWYTMVVKQYELTTEAPSVEGNDVSGEATPSTAAASKSKMELLAEEIRRAEIAVSMSMVSTETALKKVRDRVQMISSDRSKRFEILKELLEDLCLREMNWHVHLTPPPVAEVLELRRTDRRLYHRIPALAGMLGIPLMKANHTLPIG